MSNDSQTKRRKDLRAKLIDAFSDAVGEGRRLSRDEVRALGIPAKYVDSVARASLNVTDDAEAVNLAAEWGDDIADALDADDNMTVDDRIKKIPRIA